MIKRDVHAQMIIRDIDPAGGWEYMFVTTHALAVTPAEKP